MIFLPPADDDYGHSSPPSFGLKLCVNPTSQRPRWQCRFSSLCYRVRLPKRGLGRMRDCMLWRLRQLTARTFRRGFGAILLLAGLSTPLSILMARVVRFGGTVSESVAWRALLRSTTHRYEKLFVHLYRSPTGFQSGKRFSSGLPCALEVL